MTKETEGSTIERVKDFLSKDKKIPFVMVPIILVIDPRLSWKAKGLYIYMLSRPDDWKFYELDLVKRSKDGKSSVKSAIQELLSTGWIYRWRILKNGKPHNYHYVIYIEPQHFGYKEVETVYIEADYTPEPKDYTSEQNKTKVEENMFHVKHLEGDVYEAYENYIGKLTPMMKNFLDRAVDTVGTFIADTNPETERTSESFVIEALKMSHDQADRPNFMYAEKILERWATDGYDGDKSGNWGDRTPWNQRKISKGVIESTYRQWDRDHEQAMNEFADLINQVDQDAPF
jgi:hypothetical protein